MKTVERVIRMMDQTNKLFFAKWLHFADIAMITFLPWYLLNTFLFQNEDILESLSRVISVNGVIVLYAIFMVGVILWSFYNSIAAFLLADLAYQKKMVHWTEVYKQALKKFLPVFCLKILCSVRVLLWSLLLILPGIYFGILYSMVGQISLFGAGDEKDFFKSSKSLVQPQFKFAFWAFLFGMMYIGVFALALRNFFEAVYYSLYFVVMNVIAAKVTEGVAMYVGFLVVVYALVYCYTLFRSLEEEVKA